MDRGTRRRATTASSWSMAEDELAPTLGAQHLDDMLVRRTAGEPLQYVLGSWPFLGHRPDRRPSGADPAPETEVVAQIAIDEMVRLGARRGPQRSVGRVSSPRTRSPTSAPARARSRSRSRRTFPTPKCGPPTSARMRWQSRAPTSPVHRLPSPSGCALARATGSTRCPTSSAAGCVSSSRTRRTWRPTRVADAAARGRRRSPGTRW